MAVQNVRIALVGEDKTQPAQKGVDDLYKRIEALEKSWKEAGEASDQAGKKMTGSSKKAEESLFSLDKTINSLSDKLVAYFAFTQLMNLGKQIIAVTSEFQKFEAVLTNTLGSNTAAQVAMQKVADIAAKTNFSVKELTDSYIKFANRGIKLTASELTKLTDIANSTGKSFDQLTEAALDAFTGETERLKEFGITAKKTGETTQFTFKGVTTEVKNTQAAVKDYIISLGDLEGVAGSTAAISQTLSGQISNFGDALDQLFVTIGQGVNGPFSWLISSLTSYVTWIKESIMSTQQWQNQIANIRADKFIENFKKMNEEARMEAESSVRFDIDLQDKLIRTLDAQRKKRFIALGMGGGGMSVTEDKSKEQVELERNRLSNQKRLELIKLFYADQAKEVEKGEDVLSEKEKKARDKKLEDERKAWEKLRALRWKEIEEMLKSGLEIAEDAQKRQDDKVKAEDARHKATLTRMQKEGKEIQDHQDAVNKENARIEKEHQEKIQALRAATFDVSHQFIDALFEIGRDRNQQALDDNQTKRDQELKRVGEDKQAQAFINAKFDKEQAKLKTKQAIADKANALFGIIINTAESIIKTGAQLGYPAAIPFQVFAAAAGAIQAAVVAAKPIPKYAKGTTFVERFGYPDGVDTVPALLTRGERVVPVLENQHLKGISNGELPRLAAMYRAEPMARAELREMVRAQKETTAAVRAIRVERTHITERGLQKVVEQGNAKTKILNEQFSF
jgi:hypothetical protein